MGLIQKWLKDYLPKKDRCWKNNRHVIEVNNHTVNMDDMQGSFFVLFLGTAHEKIIFLVIWNFQDFCFLFSSRSPRNCGSST